MPTMLAYRRDLCLIHAVETSRFTALAGSVFVNRPPGLGNMGDQKPPEAILQIEVEPYRYARQDFLFHLGDDELTYRKAR